ncbi:MAG TPA: hypothetical protein VKK79_08645 [Candidatus Lokiarchaeia archaeon]|nr:hypothetical protein [Candidatus Lokiarchaeia archaeon]
MMNLKKTDLHNYLQIIFDDIRISGQIQEEVVTKGLKYNKKDAILTQKQIDAEIISVETVLEEDIKPIEKVLHKGEASLLPILERVQQEEVLIGTDDRPFYRYLKYVYPISFGKSVRIISSLDLTIVLFQRGIINREVATHLLQQLEHIGAHGPIEIMESYHIIEKEEE